MSVRYNPFGEWVITYFDPTKTNEAALLKQIRENGCPRAALIRGKGQTIALTPIITPGDTILLQLNLKQDSTLTANNLPKGWLISTKLTDLKAGIHHLSIRTPSAAPKKKQSITLKDSAGTSYTFPIELVSRIK